MKRLRQQQIRDLIATRTIRTQHELAAALRERGYRATQATISRDVGEMGLIKPAARGRAATRYRRASGSPRQPARSGWR